MSSTRPAGVPASLAGRTLGPYRLQALLGRGGMSTVYRALQTTLDRPVAVKILPPEYTVDSTLVARFLQEARSAAALQHPHVIPIYDSGQIDGLYYIAMRYIEGVPLSRAIPEHGFPVARAVAIVEQIASALDYAHARGVVHRDVSAGNVMLEPGDRVTLMDFGIAQARQTSRLTRAGIAVGTLEYLSPEQARGEIATPRSDVYALGVLTFELLTGALPFSAADDRALLLQHLNTPAPSIRAAQPEIPAAIDTALQRCLAKEPGARFASAGAFVAALQAALVDRGRRTVIAPAPVVPVSSRPARVVTQPNRGLPTRRQQTTDGAVRPLARHVRRKRRWLRPLLALVLLAALVSGAMAAGQYYAAGSRAAPTSSTSHAAGTRVVSSATHEAASSRVVASAASATSARSWQLPTPTPPAPVAVAPASPGEAVQGFYTAANAALTKSDLAQMALAYGYLTPEAQAKLPYATFVEDLKNDQSIGWNWRQPTFSADHKSATVAVDLTEFRHGGNVTSTVSWVVLNDGVHGWHLDHQQQQAFGPQDAAPAAPAASRRGRGKGKHDGD